MLILGILFLILGLLVILGERYSIVMENGQRNIRKKADREKNNFSRYKDLLAIFSLVLGILSILNYIIY